MDLAIDARDGLVGVATVDGPVTFHDVLHPANGNSDVLVVRMIPTGEQDWAIRLGDGAMQHAVAVAALPMDSGLGGGFVVAINFQGVIEHGGYRAESADGLDALLLCLDSLGGVVWARHLTGPGNQQLESLHVGATGTVTAGGSFLGELVSDGLATATSDAGDGFILQLTPQGVLSWSMVVSGAGDQAVHGVAADATGVTIAVGHFQQGLTLGSEALLAAGSLDAFALRLDAAGVPVWVRGFGDSDAQTATRVAIDDGGAIYVAGDARGWLNLGNGPLPPRGDVDVFVTRLGADGNALWSRRVGVEDGTTFSTSLDVRGNNEIRVGGECHDATGDTGADACLFTLSPADGSGEETLWSAPGNQVLRAVVRHESGALFLGGGLAGALTLGPSVTISSTDGEDAFLARIQP